MNITQDDLSRLSRQQSQQAFEKVKEIEAAAYSKQDQADYMQQLQDIDSIEDVLDYVECDGKLVFKIMDDWYYLACDHGSEVEIADLASKKGIPIQELNKIFTDLKKSFGNKIISCDARSKTSYKLLQYLLNSGDIEIIHDEPWTWHGPTSKEKFHNLRFKFTNKNKQENNNFKDWYFKQELLEINYKEELNLCFKTPR